MCIYHIYFGSKLAVNSFTKLLHSNISYNCKKNMINTINKIIVIYFLSFLSFESGQDEIMNKNSISKVINTVRPLFNKPQFCRFLYFVN